MLPNVKVMTELEITTAALAVGWVKFSYYKTDGTKRIAIGTTNKALIEQALGRTIRENQTYYANYGYFDLSRGGWRQFKGNRFIGLELSRLSNESAVKYAITIARCLNDTSKEDIDRIHCYGINLVGISFVSECERYCDLKGSGISIEELDMPIFAPKTSNVVKTEETLKKEYRVALIAELMQLRKRESEILAELLA